MSPTPLRWGFLSTARINRALYVPLHASKRNVLLAVASRSEQAASDYAREWKIPRAYGNYQALLNDADIDVIYNPLPNHLHAEWTIRALRAGKHVLCEKPLTLTVEEVETIARVAADSGKVVAEAFMYRHHPQTWQVKELVDSGALGKVRLIHGSFSYPHSRPNDVRLDPAMGGGSLWDIGCYPVSYARMITGLEPEEVFGWQTSGPTGIDETFVGQMRFPGEVYAQFDCSFRAAPRRFVEIVGDAASLKIPAPFSPGKREKLLLQRGSEVETIRPQGQELYLGEVEDMADAILLGKAPRISLADSRGNVATLQALLRSAQAGRPLKVE